MEIKKAEIKNLDEIMQIYSYARTFMQQTGNANQWMDGYPSGELITADIEKGNLYICLTPEHEITAVFFFRVADDPTYARIYEGEWLNNEPYGVIHRLAANGKVKGTAAFCINWAFEQCGNIRVDTHRDNKVMQHILTKLDYQYCGIIYIENGTERLAYQKMSNIPLTPYHIVCAYLKLLYLCPLKLSE